MADINLIPNSEKKEQVKVKAVKATTIVSIVVLILVSAVGFYLFTQTSSLKQKMELSKGNTDILRQDIQNLSETEIVARNLGQKYATISEIFKTRNYFSIMQDEFKKRVPEFVEIATFGIGRDNTINVSGEGGDYIAIARFINNLSDMKFEGADPALSGLFTDVSLSSVNLDTQSSKAKFFIVITYDPALLHK